jgi:hypothetical protein
MGKSALRCANVSVDASRKSDLGTLRFATPSLLAFCYNEETADRITSDIGK